MAIKFYSKSENYWLLSNFANIGFVIDNRKWKTVEHFYQAHKFLDSDIFEEVANASSAKTAMKIAHRHKESVQPDWESMKLAIMEQAVTAKVLQNRKVKQLLLSTGDEELIHNMPNLETFWGLDQFGNGENHLGKLFEKIRSDLMSER